MKRHLTIIISLAITVALSSCTAHRDEQAKLPDSPTNYVSWGVDEFELFGLTKDELEAKYKDRIHFAPNYSKAIMNDAKNNCKTFVGPTFRLRYNDGKVVAVQRVFEACGKDFTGPVFESKKEALEFAIKGLTGAKDPKDQEKLASAKEALEKLK